MRDFGGYGLTPVCGACGVLRLRKGVQGETRAAVLPRLPKTSAGIAKVLARMRQKVERVLLRRLTKSSASLTLLKAGPRRPAPVSMVQRILDEINVDGFSVYIGEAIAADLAEVFSAAGVRAVMVAQLGSDPPAAMVEQMDQAALDFAEERSAYLVGRRRLRDGSVVENPNPRYTISDVARNEIRTIVGEAIEGGWSTDRLKQRILDAHAFSSARAETIARTELAFAHTSGNLKGWEESGRVGGKRSILADTHPFEDVCDENEKAGTIAFDAMFPSGDPAPPYHPNCLCDVVAVLKSEMESEKIDLGRLFKHNPYHDEQGRFTTADQAMAALDAMPKSEKQWFQYKDNDPEVSVRSVGFKTPGKMFGFKGAERKRFRDLDVELKDVFATQPQVRVEGVKRKIRGDDPPSEHDPVMAVRMGGNLYLQQGHHRVAAAMLMGQPTFRMQIIDAEDWGGKIIYTKPPAPTKKISLGALLHKHNPYHDHLGRFTDAESAVYVVGMTPAQVERMIPRAPNLTAEQREAEEELIKIISRDVEGALRKYDFLEEAEGGKVINTDVARELSPTYSKSLENRARFAFAVHEPSSWLMKVKFERMVSQADTTSDVGAGIVTFLAGGGGSGKSSTTSVPGVRTIIDRSQFVVDGTLSSYRSSKAKIDAVLSNGKYVNLVFVARDPYESYMQGVVTRAVRSGRTVPYEIAADQHRGARDTFRALSEQLSGNPRASTWVVDNTHGPSGARKGDMTTLERLKYEGIKERIRYGLESEHDAGRVPTFVYEGLAGVASGGARKVHARADGGGGEVRVRKGDAASVLLGSRLRPTHLSKRRLIAALLSKRNDCHTPAGTPEGGQFCSDGDGGSPEEVLQRRYDALKTELKDRYKVGLKNERTAKRTLKEKVDLLQIAREGFEKMERAGVKFMSSGLNMKPADPEHNAVAYYDSRDGTFVFHRDYVAKSQKMEEEWHTSVKGGKVPWLAAGKLGAAGVFIHEYGHHMDYRASERSAAAQGQPGDALIRALGGDPFTMARNDNSTFANAAGRVSRYARTNGNEFFAESFTVAVSGDDQVRGRIPTSALQTFEDDLKRLGVLKK